jgi:hypothetical protein
MFPLPGHSFACPGLQKPATIPNIEQQGQTKTNYNIKYSTPGTSKNQL